MIASSRRELTDKLCYAGLDLVSSPIKGSIILVIRVLNVDGTPVTPVG